MAGFMDAFSAENIQKAQLNPFFTSGLALAGGTPFPQALQQGLQAQGQAQNQQLAQNQQQTVEQEARRKQALQESQLQRQQQEQAFQERFAGGLGLGGTGGFLSPRDALAARQSLTPQGLKKSDLVQVVDPQTGMPRFVTADEALGQEAFVKSGVSVTVGGEGQTEFEKARGKFGAKNLSDIEARSSVAQTRLNDISSVRQALDQGAFTGKFGDLMANVNEFAASFGLPADLDATSNTRIIQNRLSKMAIEATKDLKGAISEKELELAMKSIFKENTPEQAIRQSLGLLEDIASLQIQEGNLATGLANEGKFVKGFNKERNKLLKDFRKGFSSRKERGFGQQQAAPANLPNTPQVQQAIAAGYSQEEIAQFLGVGR